VVARTDATIGAAAIGVAAGAEEPAGVLASTAGAAAIGVAPGTAEGSATGAAAGTAGATAIGVAALTADAAGPMLRRYAAAVAAMTYALRRAFRGKGAPFYQDTPLIARWRWMRRRTAGRRPARRWGADFGSGRRAARWGTRRTAGRACRWRQFFG
jgi:hypothetical protein